LPSNDAFTLSLMTNKEVLKMHREATGVRQLFYQDGKVAITAKHPKTHAVYLALFNLNDEETPLDIQVHLSELGIQGTCRVQNMWTGALLQAASGTFTQQLGGHTAGLYKLTY